MELPKKMSECMEILSSGFVQAYVDFFYLTHRPDPNPAPGHEGESPEIDMTDADMAFVREHLCRAEAARRVGETSTVFDSYCFLAKYFLDTSDAKTAVYFFEKCHEISRLTGDLAGEMAANHHLGRAHEAMRDLAAAIHFHERHLALAREGGVAAETTRASKQLVLVYRAHADSLEEGREFEKAAEAHLKGLEACRDAKDRVAEGLASYRLGRCHVLLSDADTALPYLEDYLRIARELEDVEGAGAAHSALAAAFQAKHDIPKAVDHLEHFLGIARETDDLPAQAEACTSLGIIYNRQGDFSRAVDFFRKNFDVCRTMVANRQSGRAVLERARMHLGMAMGNLQMGQYLNTVNSDLPALLKWKTKRVALPSSSR